MKNTTQNAPLEKILAYFRYKKTIPYVKNKSVLDFGCGIANWNSEYIGQYTKFIHGVDRSICSENFSPNFEIFSDIGKLPFSNYEVVLSMAVFEHIEPFDLLIILDQLAEKDNKKCNYFWNHSNSIF